MTDEQTPPDWVLIEAVKRSYLFYHLNFSRDFYHVSCTFRALCDMIERYEQPPVDRKLLCAREAIRQKYCGTLPIEQIGIRAIELFEEGFGK